MRKVLNLSLFAFHFSLALVASAAPAKGPADPVAEGYPDWTGVSPNNYVFGRQLVSNAELRQRITVVVEFDAAKAVEQLEQTGSLATHNGMTAVMGHGAPDWTSVQIPHDVMVVYVARDAKGGKLAETLKGADKVKNKGMATIVQACAPVYTGITFAGAPDNGGKLPFVYVMGYEGKEPVLKEAFGAATAAAVAKAIADQKKKIAAANLTWRPYYGYVDEPKHFKDIEQALAKGKPLDAVEAKLLKGVASKDAETAKEAQMLYDALEQTRGDQIFLVQKSCAACPFVAAYAMGQVLKCWPKSKKQLSETAEKLKAEAAAQPLVKMYPKLRHWADPNFTCKNAGEAKKIVADLQKMKKSLAPLKEDKKLSVQNGASALDVMIDELISSVPSKVPSK